MQLPLPPPHRELESSDAVHMASIDGDLIIAYQPKKAQVRVRRQGLIDGALRWEVSLPADEGSLLGLTAGQRIYVNQDSKVYVLDSATGAPLVTLGRTAQDRRAF